MDDKELVLMDNPLAQYRVPLLRALVLHYGHGMTINQAFSGDGTLSKSMYYKLKAAHPNEMAALELEAMRTGQEALLKSLQALDSSMVSASVEIRERAVGALAKTIEQLQAIALGATFTVDIPKADGSGMYKKTILTRPAEMIKAAETLHKIARQGLTALEDTDRSSFYQSNLSPGPAPSQSLGVPIIFDTVSTILPDGTRFTVSRAPEGDVLEGEFEEAEAEAPAPSAPAN